ncbi:MULTISPECIES: L-lactate dehydrogenase [Anaerococcus]|jgi:putative malate dehydrogenase|uniref:L-2-hydroxyisocaproate dehydrogenase n=1 Tax=Anaerococcus octavius TaxID=54007 RepID=A0A2I1MBK5_9FIRM|nr:MULTISPECIES: L-lactate dehydrogenase [Anaerococcus]MBS6105272.1 L-lactate dehydrogenase [Anaerococcus sp.]MDU0894061.1 L-lactate dehydrogenase [Anaerococcus sp.]MDU4025271.1 L-lactate dehydrogenase [Anaerococcus sp.]MDU5535739.1 L-lactate dehydrogenase [Anaerococcus sp.]PKZ17506.1 L-lactate dehydrogenase [Anaerococcus octavius]
MKKVSIIGLGNVGATVAHTLVERKLCDEIALFDKKDGLVNAEINDLRDGMVRRNGNIELLAGEKSDLVDSDIIIFAPGDITILQNNSDRLEEFKYTKTCVEEWAPIIKDSGFKGIIVSITNPCDVIAEYMQKLTDLPKERVIGTGTVIDTARMKNAVAKYVGLDPNSIDGYVIGEHGNSQFIAWSKVSIASKSINKILDEKTFDQIEEASRMKAFEIIKGKGYTSYGIANAAAIIVETIFNDSKTILPVSSYSSEAGCYIGHPAVVGKDGIIREVLLELNEIEQEKWNHSVETIKNTRP